MIDRCNEYLAEKLRAVMGKNAPFFTRLREFKICAECHISSAVVDSDVLEYSGRPVRNAATGMDDLKLFDRTITINVALGEYKLQTLSPLFEAFVASLDRGFIHDGHYIAITLGEAGWTGKDDGLIKAEVAVELPVIFKGGIYKSKTFKQMTDVKIERKDPYGE